MQLGGMKIQKCCMNNIFDVTVWHENLHWLVLFHTWRDFHVLSWHALKMFDVNEKHVSSHDGWHLPRELHLKLRGKMAPDVTFMNWHQIAFTADMYKKSTFWCLLACKNLSCSMRVFLHVLNHQLQWTPSNIMCPHVKECDVSATYTSTASLEAQQHFSWHWG